MTDATFESANESHRAAPQVATSLVRAHAYAALAMVIISALFGIIVATKMNWPGFLGETAELTWGRVRYAHTQGIFFGWLSNAFIAFLYYGVPRLAGRSVTSTSLGWVIFVAWNLLAVLPGWALVLAGYSQPLEWAEFPIIIDGVLIAAMALLFVQFVVPFFRARMADLYVSGWYFLGGITFTIFAYAVGNFVPEFRPGAEGASYSGLWIHDAVGLWVTPLAVGIAYYVIPAASGRAIWSHFLSMIGFWLLFFVYPLNGLHHYLFSSIPLEMQKAAVVASVYLGVAVIIVVTNLMMTLRRLGGKVTGDPALRFVWLGIVFYLVVSLQGSSQALMPFNRYIHFSDWVIGHSHLALLGFASFIAIGGMLYAWRNTVGVRYNPHLATWSFWLLSFGLLAMVLVLTIAGMIQGQLWQGAGPWLDSVEASRPYWVIRTLTGVPIILGFGALILAMTTGHRIAAQDTHDSSQGAAKFQDINIYSHARRHRWLRGAYAVTGLAGLGFFALSFLALAVWPSREVAATIARTTPVGAITYTSAEARGREVYAREGCAYCHSQMIRAIPVDENRFGPASQAWETAQDKPQMWGTRRIGPDLSREAGRRPADWQFAHLYDPRSVVPRSNMPAFPWLFEGSATKPQQEAIDLVAYLEALGRNRILAGEAEPLTTGSNGRAPDLLLSDVDARLPGRGKALFEANCAGCHGSEGLGDGPSSDALLPHPRNLTEVRLSDERLSEVLWNGVEGSAMPGWSRLPVADLSAIAAYVETLSRDVAAEERTPDAFAGAGIYAQNCVVCHGNNGRGDGPSAGALAPAPSNFHEELPSLDYAIKVLTEGVPGTSMPRWDTKLSAEEIEMVARYVRTFYDTSAEEDAQ